MFTGEQKRILRKMGYYADKNGIMNRYLTEKGNWDSHLEKAKNFILTFTERVKPSALAVLGSGWWLDLPVEALSRLCNKLIFVDIVHPAQIIHKAKETKNLRLIEYDLTGGFVFQAYEIVKKFKRKQPTPLPRELIFPRFLDEIQADAYISLNVLSQLEALITDYLKKFKVYGPRQLNEIRKMIQQAHLQSLPEKRSCLITDFEEIKKDRAGGTKRSNLLFTPLPKGHRKELWNWKFDYSGKYYPGFETTFKVIGIEF